MTKQNKYYNLNIKLNNITKKSSKPDLYDATKNLERKRAPIFFGPYKPEEYINAYKYNQPQKLKLTKNQLKEAYKYIQLYKEDPEARLITIDKKIWIYKIIGEIKYESTDETIQKKDNQILKIVPKYYDVEIIEERETADAPYILASMKANPAFCRNTFRMIDEKKYGGNIAAIKYLINELNDFKIDPLKTLSSVQLETLVVKIFEKNGAFIPAWRGGTLKDIDIIAEFEENIPDNLLIQKIKEKKIKIQVKLQLNEKKKVEDLKKSLASDNFFLITAEDEPHKDLKEYYEKNYLTSKWIKKQIYNYDEIKKWYEECIKWLPTQNRKETVFK